jgi:hypothetical protein
LRILITNNTLDIRAGSELFVRDLARALIQRGHSPIAYSSQLGDVADELRRASVPVIDNLAALTIPPDVIHGQHHLDAMSAMLRFPQVPALYMCHGWLPWEELPPLFPSIARYIAVDDLCRERLETTAGIAPEKIRTIYNAVDLTQFTLRDPLPVRPRTALVFSNYAGDDDFVAAIRAACQEFGIEHLQVVGARSGNVEPHPEAILAGADVVFAKARCALEAMAVGCAVIVADGSGLGGLVTPDNVESMRRLNFGIRTMQRSRITRETVLAELNHFDAQRSLEVSLWIRDHASADRAMDQLETTYAELTGERQTWSVEAATAANSAASAYLVGLARATKQAAAAAYRAALDASEMRKQIILLSDTRDALTSEKNLAIREKEILTQQLISANELSAREKANLLGQLAAAEGQIADVSEECQRWRHEHEQARRRLQADHAELQSVLESRTWRAFTGYRRLRRWLGGRGAADGHNRPAP